MDIPNSGKINSSRFIVLAILGISLFFNLFGINWGLPSHWHPDESTTISRIVIPMARNLDPNPHSFLKPSFYYYFLQVVLSPYYLYYKYNKPELNIGFAELTANVFLISRITTALIGTVSVFLLYLITRTVFNLNVGLLASFFLAVSMAFSSHSHFAYMDIPMICLLLLMILFSIQYLRTSRLSRLYLAAFVGGLSVSTKYNSGLFVILTILICHLDKAPFKKNINITDRIKALVPKSLLISLILVIAGFFLATPFALLDFPAFADNLLEQLFIAERGYKGFAINEWSGFQNYLYLNRAVGTPLLILALCGVLWGIANFSKKPSKITAILLFPPIIYFFYISNWRFAALRYVLLLLPFMAFWAAALTNLSLNNSKGHRMLIYVLVIFVGVYSCFYTFRGVRSFTADTRNVSGHWIRENIPLGSQVEVYSFKAYLPDFPKGVNVQRIEPFMSPNTDYNKFKIKMKNNELVRLILKFYGKSIKNDVDTRRQLDNDKALLSVSSLSKRNPDFIVLTSIFYTRFMKTDRINVLTPYPELTHFFEKLVSGEAGYEIVKVFENKTPTGEFLNPTIKILKKINHSTKNSL